MKAVELDHPGHVPTHARPLRARLRTLYTHFFVLGSFWQEFLEEAALEVTPATVVLDAGAGTSPHRKRFAGCRSYLAVDRRPMRGADGILGVIADLADLPLRGEAVGMVLCTQTLEHTNNPTRIASEFYRVLRPGGRVFLSVPLVWPEHLQPMDYFRFTQFGVRHVMESAGFRIVRIQSMGGFFSVLRLLWDELWRGTHFPGNRALSIVTAPFRWMLRFAGRWVLAPCCYALDRHDRDRSYTLGYFCVGVKPSGRPDAGSGDP